MRSQTRGSAIRLALFQAIFADVVFEGFHLLVWGRKVAIGPFLVIVERVPLNLLETVRFLAAFTGEDVPKGTFEFFTGEPVYHWIHHRVAVTQPKYHFEHILGRRAFAT